MQFNQKHVYFYQVQGQLEITDYCLFIKDNKLFEYRNEVQKSTKKIRKIYENTKRQNTDLINKIQLKNQKNRIRIL